MQRLFKKVAIGAVVFNVALNLLVIPRYGYLGASATTVATESFIACLCIAFLERAGYPLRVRQMAAPSFFGLATICITSGELLRYGAHLILITSISLAVYAVIIYKLGFDQEDKQLVANLITHGRSGKILIGEIDHCIKRLGELVKL